MQSPNSVVVYELSMPFINSFSSSHGFICTEIIELHSPQQIATQGMQLIAFFFGISFTAMRGFCELQWGHLLLNIINSFVVKFEKSKLNQATGSSQYAV